MFLFHKLLAKCGHKTARYRLEEFKTVHPQYIVIDTVLREVMRDSDPGKREERYVISAIDGDGVFFYRWKQELYVEVGRAQMVLQLDSYGVDPAFSSRSGLRYFLESSSKYQISFDAVSNATYRMRFDRENRAIEIVYERGNEHKIYTFS